MKRLLFFFLCLAGCLRAGDMEGDFRNPPLSARPYVWWHWLGPCFSQEGITKDLEAMREAGIGGATIFNITSGVQKGASAIPGWPQSENTYRGETYWKALAHAAREANRLGLELGLHNTVGYSTTGGPWITPERGTWNYFTKEEPLLPAGLLGPVRLVHLSSAPSK